MNESNNPTLDNPTLDNKRYLFYIKPTIRGSSVSLVIIIIVFFIWLMFKWSYTYMNWDSEKCKNLNFYFAPIYGQDSTKTFNDCVSNKVSDKVKTAIDDVEFSKEINKVDTGMKKISQEYEIIKSGGPEIVNKFKQSNTDIVNNIKQNIINVKNTLSKVLGSVIISSYLNNGVIQATKSFNTSLSTGLASDTASTTN